MLEGSSQTPIVDEGVEDPVQNADRSQHPLFPMLEMIAHLLADGLDHPEVWDAVTLIEPDEQRDLYALVTELRPFQQDRRFARSFDILAAFLETLAIDRVAGLANLHQLEATYSLNPQVAGAIFYASRCGDGERSADLSTKFCEAPFVKFETLIDGTVAPCCSIWTQKRLGELDNQSLEDIWNSQDAQEMRESIHDGSFRFCNKQRCTLITQDALPERDAVTDPALRKIIDEGAVRLDVMPRWLFLAHDLSCNLSCPSCRSELMGSTEEQERRFGIIEREVFHPILNADGKVVLSLSGQGDPWASPHYRSILRYLADHDLPTELNLHTNGLLLSEGRWQQYLGLEKYRPLVDVSIDACSPEVYEIVRRPGKWEKLLPNLQFIARKRAEGTFREFHINATVQLDNYHEMPSLMAFGQELGVDTVRLYMIQNTGGHLAPDYRRKNVADKDHPLHKAFLETLRHPALGSRVAHLYDVGEWRQLAFDATLPSDRLSREFTCDELLAAINDAVGRDALTEVVALCAAGPTRLPEDPLVLTIEAKALELLGFPQLAGYRRARAERLPAPLVPA